MTTLDPESYLVLPDDVDLTNCDREAIDIPGAIQSHGALLVVDPARGRIVVASANASEMLGVSGSVLDGLLSDLPLIRGGDDLARAALDTDAIRRMIPVATADNEFDAVVHHMTDMAIVEFEPRLDWTGNIDLVSRSSALLTGLEHSGSKARQVAANLMHELIGYDRVMVYTFHEDGHGEVVAEATRPGVGSYLSHHFPAGDIPVQARALYMKNWTRLIVDSAATTVPLVPARHPATGRPINLAQSQLRAVSPIHLEYLRNMGVASSLSISLVSGGELVGLIACHHFTPRRVPYVVRTAAELIGRLLSEQFSRADAVERAHRSDRQHDLRAQLLRSDGDVAAVTDVSRQALDLLGATAFVGRVHGRPVVSGDVSAGVESAVADIAASADGVVAADQLDGVGGGALVVPFADDDSYLAWFRPPVTSTVTWAGRPEEHVDDDAATLRPRTSFAAWQEIVDTAGRPWTAVDIDQAAQLRDALNAVTTSRRGGSDMVISELMNWIDRLERRNAELAATVEDREAMLAAASHDLRAPLRAVKHFTDALTRDTQPPDAADAADLRQRIDASVLHMRELLDAIDRWVQVGIEPVRARVDLRDTLDSVVQALGPLLAEVDASVRIDPLPVVAGDPGLLRELFQNLLHNAVKYRADDRPLRITVTADWSDDWVRVSVVDNAVGIPSDAIDRAFALFAQLQPGSEGFGLGLPLVRRIAAAHGGRVDVQSVEGEGSVFRVELPLFR